MPTVAEQLRAAREARNLSVEQVAEMTKLRTDHVRALEEGNHGFFHAPVYIRGFVRTYATLLKLDVGVLLEALDQEMGEGRPPFHGIAPTEGGRPAGMLNSLTLLFSRMGWKVGATLFVVLAAAILAISAVAIWKHRQTADPLKAGPIQRQSAGKVGAVRTGSNSPVAPAGLSATPSNRVPGQAPALPRK